MKRSVKYIVFLLILILAFPQAAHASDDILPASVEIRYGNRNISSGNQRIIVATGDEIEFVYRINPTSANTRTDVTWRSSNPRVAEVDDWGRVFANESGQSTISVRTDNGRSASVAVYVPRSGGVTGRVENITDTTTGPASSPLAPPPAALTPPPTTTITLSGQVPREVLLNAVRLGNSGIPAVLTNYETVSHESLMAAIRLGNFPVRFETMLGNTLVGRITLSPDIANNPAAFVRLGVYSQVENTARVQGIFNRFFTNATVVVLVEQTQFPAPVEISVRAGALSGGNLHFYSYDAPGNFFVPLSVTNARRDAESLVYFTTDTGGYIVVSDGPLTRRP